MIRRTSPDCGHICQRLAQKMSDHWKLSCLPSTIPQIQQQIAHESDVAVLYVDGSPKSPDILRHVIAEDDRSHGRLARARPTHQQHFALFLALATLRRAHDEDICRSV
jgi:hypothetical protein